MQALKQALLDLRVAVLAEIARRNMLTADPATAREVAAHKHDEHAPVERTRSTRLISFWKRLTSRRPAKPRMPAIWPTPEHLTKSDHAPDDRG